MFDSSVVMDKSGSINFLNILRGGGIGFGIGIVLLFTYAAIFTWTDFSESNAPALLSTTGIICSALSGFFAAAGSKRSGWLYGCAAGIVYTILMNLVGVLFFTTDVNVASLSLSVLKSVSLGAVGGILAVNILGNKRKR